MAVIVWIEVICDNCEEGGMADSQSCKTRVMESMKKQGWAFRKDKYEVYRAIYPKCLAQGARFEKKEERK